MNLIEESFQTKQEQKKKRTTGIILGAIVLVVIAIIAIISYLMYIQSTTLRVVLNGQVNENLKQLFEEQNPDLENLLQEGGTIYLPIKSVASYFDYQSYNGDYSQKSEDTNKCYVQTEGEVANFTLASNKIYKLNLAEDHQDYEYQYMDDPVKSNGGVLCASLEGIEKGFNVSIQYNKNENRIYIYTLPYLYQAYSPVTLDLGYMELSDVLSNQKALLQSMMVVTGSNEKVGVVDTEGNIILDVKYDDVKYMPDVGDFLVTADEKVGVISSEGDTRIPLNYDSIELMDSDSGLYVAERDGKFGVLDTRGNIKIYIENDEIGINADDFAQNDIKNKYILADNLIPVRRNNLWGLYDKNGRQIVEYKYDSFGYKATSNRDALNLLVIPGYNVIVAELDDKYTLINSSGQELFATIADDIYMTISGGQKHYYINVNDNIIDAEEYLNSRGIRKNSSDSSSSGNTNTTNTSTNTTNTNQTNETSENVSNNENQTNQENQEGQNNEAQDNQNSGENEQTNQDNQEEQNQ